MVVSKKWLDYPSIKKLRTYLAAKNGGYQYVKERSLLTGYVEPIMYFCRFVGYDDPESLLEDIKKGKINIVDRLVDWRMDLLDKGRAPSTISRYNNGLKKWFYVNRVDVNWDDVNLSIPLPKHRSIVEDRAPTVGELRKLVQIANIKMKAFIELAATSGIRAGALCQLRLDDLDFERDKDVVVIRVRPELSKTMLGYFTIANDEARDILQDYIKLKGLSKWLFPSRNGGPVRYETIQVAYARLLRKVGLDEKSHGQYVLHLHTLRKFFRTRLEGYLTRSEIEYLMGHLRKEYLDGSYFRPPSDDLIRRYKSAMDRLYILKSKEVKEEDIRKRTILDMAKLLGFPDEKIRMLENLLEKKTIDQAIEEIRKFRPF